VTEQYCVSAHLPTRWGDFDIHGFTDEQGKEHLVLSYGKISADQPVLVRVHSECLTGDALFSLRCDCGPQLQASMQAVVAAGSGLILYLRQEGRGIGLVNKIKAYKLQDAGADTVEANEQLGFSADQRDYAICKIMLEHFKVKKIRLLTNNPRKQDALEKLDFQVVERLPIWCGGNPHNEKYLSTKQDKLGHHSH